MKLATYKDGSRDGQLVVVSRDLSTAHYATGIAHRLQQVLDDWNFFAPQLQDLSSALNSGKARHAFPFDPAMCMAPLPRAFQRVEGQAWLHHAALLGDTPDAGVPDDLRAAPTMHQGGSDDLLGPCDPVVLPDETTGIDFGAGIAVITGDVAMGATPEQALDGIRLVMLSNGIVLREPARAGQARGSDHVQSRPATAFSPVAVTPDELGEAWAGGRAHLTVQCHWNSKRFGLCDAGADMHFHFGQLMTHLCRTRRVRAGTIVNAGPVGNAPVTGDDGRRSWPKGCACIAEKRAIETLLDGQPSTGFMRFGDTVRIESRGRDGHSVFGAIDQLIRSDRPEPPAPEPVAEDEALQQA